MHQEALSQFAQGPHWGGSVCAGRPQVGLGGAEAVPGLAVPSLGEGALLILGGPFLPLALTLCSCLEDRMV